MSTYFEYFPRVNYGDRRAIDITRRAKFVSGEEGRPYVFLPYTIGEYEKPEDIAQSYYGDISYTWLVLLSNDIFDVYTQWPMEQEVFQKFLMTKYKDRSGSEGFGVLEWTMNEQIDDNIEFYYNDEEELKYSKDTIRLSDSPDPKARPIRVYELETLQNENKRNIHLIDSRFKEQIRDELKSIVR
tara:strand:+ start:709 stop:1263 length:555 start_codon:yes stop_codon:yes gene_type:complete